MRIFSFGGGVQSTAALVLAARGQIDYRAFLFSNVGDDSENPDTISYVREVSIPFAKHYGIELHEIFRVTNNAETLYQRTLRETRSVKIPVHMPNGAPGKRSCTQDYKRSVIRRWLGKGDHIVGLGISLDEFHRMRTDSGYENIVNEYPLIDLRLTRNNCIQIIREANLPQPPKSSCWFCPFHSMAAWSELRRNKPDLFEKAIDLEKVIIQKRLALGRDPVYLTQKARPIADVVPDQPLLISDEQPCDSGYCFT